MKALKSPIFPLLMGLISLITQAQQAGFEVEGDLYPRPSATTNDWFAKRSGGEVLSSDSLTIFQDHINNRRNVSFYSGMSVPDMSIVDGRVWYTANFGHDHLATDTDANPRSEDPTRFAPWNYTENPAEWKVVEGYLEPWVDLTDSYLHLRRDGLDASNDLFLFGGLSALKIRKGRFLDMEFYITDLEIQGDAFTNTGTEGGHTAWQFDAAGKVIAPGDLDLGFAAENGNVIRTEIYIWISRTDYENNHGFNYEAFRATTNEDAYGYARIATDPAMSLGSNNAPTAAPPWGTFNRKLRVESDYKNKQFLEFGLNLSALGLDPAQYAVDVDPCGLPWKKMLVKSRKSTDIGAFLEDFAGPYPLFDRPVEPAPAGTIEPPAPFNSCNATESRRLRAVNQVPDYIYTWRTLDAGLAFPDGSNEISGPSLFEIAIDKPGNYELSIRPATYCGVAGEAGTLQVNAAPCAIQDQVEVDFNSPTVIAPADNDIDLENDIDPQSINTSGLQGPANGTVTIAGTGEVTYTPNTGYSGPDSFEYRICDTNGLCDTAFVEVLVNSFDPPPTEDSDGDGVPDSLDLDDDNDGIPDQLEMQLLPDRSQPDCQGEFALDFSQEPVLESGVDKTVGAIYRIASISPGIDALVTVTDIHNAEINFIDRNNEAAHAFRPSTSFEFMSDGEQAMVEYTIRFVESGTYTPLVLGVLFMNFNDIDGVENYGEQSWAYNPMSFVVSDPTELTMEGEGQWLIGTAGTTDYDGATNQNPQVNFGISFASRSEVKVRVGAISRKNGRQSTTRQHNIEFQCVTNYVNPLNVNLDADYDGIANHLDLDSDNDGIYDAHEAGHGIVNSNGTISGTYGSNGLADSVENSPDSGSINYSLRDTASSGLPDFLNTDSDADGCSDANEAYSDALRDGGDNPYYGQGSPPAVKSNGLLQNASYTEPADADINGIADHLDPASDLIIASPADVSACPGDEISFSGSVPANAVVRWEEYVAGVWQEVPADDRIQGRNSAVLQWVAIAATDDGRQFRMAVSAPGQVCEQFSEPATLSVGAVPPVVANASATTINAGDWVTLTGSGASTYSWDRDINDGEAVQLFRTTTFTVSGWDADGCVASDEITIVVNSLIDLELDLSSSKTQPNVGDVVDLQFDLRNLGPNRATGIHVIVVVPDGMLITAVGPGATLTGNLLKWEVDQLDQDSVTLDIQAEVLIPEMIAGEYKWVAQVVRSDQDDADSTPANFEDVPREDDEVMLEFPTPTAELSVYKSIDREVVAVRDTVQFQVELINEGPFTATGLQVDEQLPSGYELIGTEAAPGNYDPATGLWQIDSLTVGQQALLHLQAIVNVSGEYLNTATLVNSLQWENDSLNNSSSSGVTRVHRVADLALTKTTDAVSPDVGDIITFRLLVSNAGPDHATHVIIEDRVPEGYTIISAGQQGQIENNVIRWEIEELPPGQHELTYTLQINPPTGAAGEYLNIAWIDDSRQTDPDSTPGSGGPAEDDEDTWEFTPPPANLVVSKSISVDEASVGELIEFVVNVENTGSYAITNLVLEDQLPPGYALVNHSASHGSYNPDTGNWTIPALEKGEISSLTMEVRVTAEEDYLNVARVVQADPVLSDEAITSASAGLTNIHQHADLSLEKTADTDAPEVGEIITFRLLLSNAGPAHATNVIVEDRVPSGFTILSAGQGGVISGDLITWEIADLPPGEIELTYELKVNPPTGTAGEYRNIAMITQSGQEDPDSNPEEERNGGEDDEDSWEIVPATASLYIEKTVNKEEAAVGEIIDFQIAVTNTGVNVITNLVMEDRLPEGYKLLNYKVTHGSYDYDTGLWLIPILELGETAIMTMNVEVTEIEDYVNIVRVHDLDQWIPEDGQVQDEAGISVRGTCLNVYNEFSPNQDGKNEVLWIDCIEEYPDNSIQVFDRWGSKVFEAKAYDNTWTGTNQNPRAANGERELPVGTYYYILKLGVADLPDKTGWIYISR